jgi:hypothetical protein
MQSISKDESSKATTDKERRLRIARQIISQTKFSAAPVANFEVIDKDVLEANRLAAVRTRRLQQTQTMLSDQSNTVLYSMQLERQSMTTLRLQNVINDVNKQNTLNKQSTLNSNLSKLVSVLRHSLKVS